MPAGGSDFEGALGALLALDVLEVEPRRRRRDQARLGRRQQLRAFEMVDDRQQVGGGDDLDLAGPGGLAAAGGGADDAALPPGRGERGEQYTGDAGQRAVERQLAERGVAAQFLSR